MTVLVMGGTNEGRQAAEQLGAHRHKVIVSTATVYGENFQDVGIKVRCGPLNKEGLVDLIAAYRVRVIVDATHPFAREITPMTRAVCKQLNLPYLRFERRLAKIPQKRIRLAGSALEARDVLLEQGGRVFLATGVKSIGLFVSEAEQRKPDLEFFARILPTMDSITEARRWLPPSRIIAAVGPFDHDFNLWCWRRFKIDTLVTKDSGAGVGVEEKIESALELGLKVIVIKRPEPVPSSFSDLHLLVAAVDRVLGMRAPARPMEQVEV